MWPKAAVVILNWNGWQDTVDLLNSLNVTTYDPLLVIIVDNNSTDGESLLRLKAWLKQNQIDHTIHVHTQLTSSPYGVIPSKPWNAGKHFMLIESKQNLGFCAGNNLGLEIGTSLGAEYLLILNNDTVVASDFLEPMVSIASKDDSIGLVGGVIAYCNDPDVVWWAGGHFDRFLNASRYLDRQHLENLPETRAYETEWVSGCMTLVPAHVYQKFGGYWEEYFIWSEEWDYSLKLSQAGLRHMVARDARICHKVGRSLGIMQPLNYYYGLRNALLFKRRYLPIYIWYPYLGYYLINRVVRFSQLALQGRLDLVQAGSAAIWDFFRGRTGIWQSQLVNK